MSIKINFYALLYEKALRYRTKPSQTSRILSIIISLLWLNMGLIDIIIDNLTENGILDRD